MSELETQTSRHHNTPNQAAFLALYRRKGAENFRRAHCGRCAPQRIALEAEWGQANEAGRA